MSQKVLKTRHNALRQERRVEGVDVSLSHAAFAKNFVPLLHAIVHFRCDLRGPRRGKPKPRYSRHRVFDIRFASLRTHPNPLNARVRSLRMRNQVVGRRQFPAIPVQNDRVIS